MDRFRRDRTGGDDPSQEDPVSPLKQNCIGEPGSGSESMDRRSGRATPGRARRSRNTIPAGHATRICVVTDPLHNRDRFDQTCPLPDSDMIRRSAWNTNLLTQLQRIGILQGILIEFVQFVILAGTPVNTARDGRKSISRSDGDQIVR